jgi:hypothetical protein
LGQLTSQNIAHIRAGISGKKMRVMAALVMLAVAGCGSDTSVGDSQIFEYVETADDIMSEVAGGMDEANFDAQNAIAIFANACKRARSFTQSLEEPTVAFDPALWDRYELSFYSTLLPCYMHDALIDGSVSDYGMYVGQYFPAERCLSTGLCDDVNGR